ncbi:MAG: hypothetical protein RR922_02755 [Clostridia bacterium]
MSILFSHKELQIKVDVCIRAIQLFIADNLIDLDNHLVQMLSKENVLEILQDAKIEKSYKCLYDVYTNTFYLTKKATCYDIINGFFKGIIRSTLRDEYFAPLADYSDSYNIDYKYKCIYEDLVKLDLLDKVPDKYTEKIVDRLCKDEVDCMNNIMAQEDNLDILEDVCKEVAYEFIQKFKKI